MATKSTKSKSTKSKSTKKSNTNNKKNNNNNRNTKHKTYKVIKLLSNIKNANEFYKKLSTDEKNVLSHYKGFGYVNMNSYLYNKNIIKDLYISDYVFKTDLQNLYSNNTKNLFNYKNIILSDIPKFVEFYINNVIIKKINILDSIFKKSNIPKLIGSERLFRGSRGHTGTNEKSKIGDEIIFKNFLSTSTEKEVSMNFTQYDTKKNKTMCCMYVLTNLKDIPYIYIPWNIKKNLKKEFINTSNIDEFEYLLPRNLKFKIINITNGINGAFNKLTFEQLDFLMQNKKLNNLNHMNNTDVNDIIDKMYKKIKCIHLEFVEQISVTELPNYVYNKDINLHIDKLDDESKD